MQLLKIHITIQKDGNVNSKTTLYNRGDSRVVAFFNHLNPTSWFSQFRDIKISLEEFAPNVSSTGGTGKHQ